MFECEAKLVLPVVRGFLLSRVTGPWDSEVGRAEIVVSCVDCSAYSTGDCSLFLRLNFRSKSVTEKNSKSTDIYISGSLVSFSNRSLIGSLIFILRSTMSQTHSTDSDRARRAAHPISQPASTSESSDRSAIALGAISTTLAALQTASGFAPVPALKEAVGLAIILLEGFQVSRNVYVFGSLTQQFSREPRTIKAPTLNSPRMPVDSS
jgi:hypothetical protein